jgi:S1-C subfamily serine protease
MVAGCVRTSPDAPAAVPSAPAYVDPAAAFRVVAVNFAPIEAAEGSGFFVSAGGLAVTCYHIVGSVADDDGDDDMDCTGPRWAILADGRKVGLIILPIIDEGSDLALVQVIDGGPFPFLELADAEPQPGDEVRTLTSSGVSPGRVIGAGVEETFGDVFELTTEGIGLGASGGAVVDRARRVVGVILGESDEGATLAVPAGPTRSDCFTWIGNLARKAL